MTQTDLKWERLSFSQFPRQLSESQHPGNCASLRSDKWSLLSEFTCMFVTFQHTVVLTFPSFISFNISGGSGRCCQPFVRKSGLVTQSLDFNNMSAFIPCFTVELWFTYIHWLGCELSLMSDTHFRYKCFKSDIFTGNLSQNSCTFCPELRFFKWHLKLLFHEHFHFPSNSCCS